MQDQEIWHNKWANNQIGFHLSDVNPLLSQYWQTLNPKPEDKVLVPLCGKSEDLIYLAERHQSVTGVELSQVAVRAFFAEHLYTPQEIILNNQHTLYEFDELSIYTGDFFTAPLDNYELIYDRAALIALPQALRSQYAQRLQSVLKPGGKILLISLDYPQEQLQGPPYSVPQAEIEELFAGMKITRLHQDIADQNHRRIQQGLSHFHEEVWLIEA